MDLNKVTLKREDQNKWLKNVLVFLIPLATLYLGQLGITFQTPGHIFSFQDFIPNVFVLGGIVYYLQSTLLDYYKKLSNK